MDRIKGLQSEWKFGRTSDRKSFSDIPQGLILAPKLWNDFINDMEYEVKCTLRKWAMVHTLEGRAASVI